MKGHRLQVHGTAGPVTRRLSPQANTMALVLLVCLALVGLDTWRTWTARSIQLGEMTVATSNLARSIAQQTDDTLQAADTVLAGLAEQLEAEPASVSQRASVSQPANVSLAGRLHRMLAAQVSALPRVDDLAIYDENGRWITGWLTSSPLSTDVSGSKSFTYHRSHADRGAHIGPPSRSGDAGRWTMIISRRISHADGSFAGLVLAMIDLASLRQDYDALDIGTSGAITLMQDDGTLLLRRPFDEAQVGQRLADGAIFQDHVAMAPFGSFEAASQFDDVVRLTSYRHLASYPLLVTAALSKEDGLESWRVDAQLHFIGVTILTLIILLLGRRLARQIQQRQDAEAAAATAGANYRLLAEHSMDMIARIGLDRVTRFVSPGCRHLLGYEPAELTDVNIMELVHPDDRDALADKVARAASGVDRLTGTHRLCRKDGRYLWVETAIRLIRDPMTGMPTELVASARNISQRKEAEARLLDAIESINDGFALWNGDWRFVMCNSRYREMYKLSADFLVPGTSMREVLLGGTRNGQYGEVVDAEAYAAANFATGSEAGAVFERLLGDGRWILGSNRPTAMGGWVGIRTDITAQKERELELRNARELLERQAADLGKLAEDLEFAKQAAEQASLVKSEFLANMSHEIRTPMNGIIGMNSLLLRTPLTPDQRKFAETVHASADALLDIINDILDVSKLEAGRVELESIDFDLTELVEGAVELLSPRALQKNLEIAAFLDDAARLPVRGDPARLRQIILNLLSNAIKFTETGFVAVEVTAARVEAGHADLRIEINDTGIGISDAAKLFEKFAQADGSITRRFGGTGLGLNISKQLIGLMGGRIGVTDRPAGGTTFWFEISLPDAARPVGPRQRHRRKLDGLRALVVDDVAINRSIFVRQLRTEGMAAEDAPSAAAALTMLAEAAAAGRPFDLVLTDRVMPGMAGEDLAEAIRAEAAGSAHRWPQPKLVLASSTGIPQHDDKAAHVGFDAFLAKPVRFQALIDCIEGLLGRTAAADGLADRATAALSTAATKQPSSHPTPPSAGHILLAEDNEINRLLATVLLQQAGYTVDAAEDGAKAIDALGRRPYALVLMDVQMPHLDGLEATRRIRAMEGLAAAIPIVAMTANAMEGDRERCLEAGMNDYVSKPIDARVFLNTVAKWIRGPDAEQAKEHPGALPGNAPGMPVPSSREPLPDILDEAHLDHLARLMPEPSFNDLVGEYLEGARDQLRRIQVLSARGDFAGLVQDAHDLKSTSGNFGAWRLQQLAERLEAASNAADGPMTERVVSEINVVCDETWAALRRYLMPTSGTSRWRLAASG